MIQFDVLNITESHKGFYLNIDVKIKDIDEYNNMYISEILIDTQETFTAEGPSTKAISVYTANEKSDRVVLHLSNKDNLNITPDNIYFIYVITEYETKDSTPELMNSVDLGITYYEQYILINYLKYIKEIDRTGEVPKNFIDYYLQVKAFEVSLETGNYIQAISYWNNFK